MSSGRLARRRTHFEAESRPIAGVASLKIKTKIIIIEVSEVLFRTRIPRIFTNIFMLKRDVTNASKDAANLTNKQILLY